MLNMSVQIPFCEKHSTLRETTTHEKPSEEVQSYTNIYVNTQLFLLLMQLYFVLDDMFRLIKQPSSGQLTIE